MDIMATQRLSDDNESDNHNLIVQFPTPESRVHQVASLCIKNKKYPIFEGINTVGRNPTSDIVLTDSTVSKNHAEIEAHPKTAFVCDLGSSNKTRLSNEILRPQRFYQVNDGVQLTFGTVNGHYLFLRDLDNSIIVPETPAPGAKLRCTLSSVRPKKLNNSLLNANNEGSIITSTLSLNNDDREFAIPSSQSGPSSSRTLYHNFDVQNDGTEISIHDVPTQQPNQSEDVDESIHSCQTQPISELHLSNMDNNKDIHEVETQQLKNEPKKLSKNIYDIELQKLDYPDDISGSGEIHAVKTQKVIPMQKIPQSIHDLGTQKFDTTDEPDIDDVTEAVKNPIKKSQRYIHEIETQKILTTAKVDDNTLSNELNLSGKVQESIHDLETQKLDKVVIQNTTIDGVDDDDDDPNIAETQEFNSNAKVAILANRTNKDEYEISGLNSHIINETDDDESETDEEGEFSNIQIINEKDNASKKQINKINEGDSETDEDGEFETLRHNCLTSLMNSNKQISYKDENNKTANVSISRTDTHNDLKSPCLNERSDCESPVPPNIDQLRGKQIENMVEDVDNEQSLAVTQVVRMNRQEKSAVNKKKVAITYSDDDTPIQRSNDSKTNHVTDLLDKDEDKADEIPSMPSRLTRSKCKSVESTKRSLYKNLIFDDDMAPTQIIEMSKRKMSRQQLPKPIMQSDDDIEPTQIVHIPKKRIITKRISKNNRLADNDNGEVTTQLNNTNTATKNNSENDEDATQIIEESLKINDSIEPNKSIESSQNVLNTRGGTLDENYFDDTTPTQIINVRAMAINFKEKSEKAQAEDSNNKNVTKNRKSTKSESDDDDDDNNKMPYSKVHKTLKTPRISLKLQRNMNTPPSVVAEKSKKMENSNDSVSKDLSNLFGEESQETKPDEPIPLATQQLQDILEPVENNGNKNIKKFRRAEKFSSSHSSGIESQEVYFSKLHSKRKRNVIQSSEDSTESESENNTLSAATKNLVLDAGISRFKKDVAVYNNGTIGVCELPTKKCRGDSDKGEESTNLYDNEIVHNNNVECCVNVDGLIPDVKFAAKVSDGEVGRKEEDDILAGLPEVRIYGTASYPASPSSSVCSLDDWELFERKRQERLKVSTAKKPLTTIKSLSRISPDNKNKTKPIIGENSSTIKLSGAGKVLESSDDEDLNFEDLKKMAVGFIAADSRTKNLSIKLEKIPIATKYQSCANYRTNQGPISPVDNSQVSTQRRARGRPKNKIDSAVTLQNDTSNLIDDKYTVGASSRKRPRLNEKSENTTSGGLNLSVESQEIQIIPKKSTPVEVKKRTKKIPIKFQDETNTPKRQTVSKQKKFKSNIVDSPSTCNRSRVQQKVLFTGVFSSNYEVEVKQCGGTIVEKPEQATILVTDKIRRTNKFFCAISRCIPIVSVTWIEDSGKEKHFLHWSEYILKDPVTEAKYNFKLMTSLERAKMKKLLDGYTFIITGKVTKPGPEEIKSMVQMSGGKAVVRPPKLWLPNTIIVSCTDDVPKVQTILSKVPKQFKIPVYTTEFLLLGILKQELNFSSNKIEL